MFKQLNLAELIRHLSQNKMLDSEKSQGTEMEDMTAQQNAESGAETERKAYTTSEAGSKGGSTSKEKSQVVSFETTRTALSLMSNDLPIEQLDNGHYVFRRGSTEVHIETYAGSSASDVIGEDKRSGIAGGLKLFSIIEAMLIFLVTIVIKLSVVLSPAVPDGEEKKYMLSLYAASVVWLIHYNLKGTCKKRDQVRFAKSHESSNRWLKGVIVLFGIGIVIKDGLEFLAGLVTASSSCKTVQLGVAESFFHALFILNQMKYLFRFSKVFIRNYSAGTWTGLMLLIGVNLSIWVASIIEETVNALETHAGETISDSTSAVLYSTTASVNASSSRTDSSSGTDPCVCHTSFCNAVEVAEKFLFPFQIEFSLVASCLLAVTWSNIGKLPPPCSAVIKPSYKFYQHYLGVFFGGVVFFVTLVIIIVLGTMEPVSFADGVFQQSRQLTAYNGYWLGVELAMMVASGIGFYFFWKIRRPTEKSSMLDNVLLLICVVGPLSISLFSMLAVIAGPDSKVGGWVLSLMTPIVDILQCLTQLVFILFGLQREPVTSSHAKETATSLRKKIASQLMAQSSTNLIDDKEIENCAENGAYLRGRKRSITSLAAAIANNRDRTPEPQAMDAGDQLSQVEEPKKDNPTSDKENSQFVPEIVVTADDVIEPSDNEEKIANGDVEFGEQPAGDDESGTLPDKHYFSTNKSVVKIVSETRVARPNTLRLYLRDILMFLIISNACLWMFMSLEGVAFTVHAYQSLFFGDSAWTTIHMICRPLSIFFRMHSAGCLFEMWSFS